MSKVKLLPIIVGMCLLALPACNKEKKEQKKAADAVKGKLTGTWILERAGTDINSNNVQNDSEIVDWPDSMLYEVSFNADGTGTGQLQAGINSYIIPSTFSWKLSDNNSYFTMVGNPYNVVLALDNEAVYIDKLTESEFDARIPATTTGTYPRAQTAWYFFKRK